MIRNISSWAAVLLAASAALAWSASATAAGSAETKVTIHGPDDVYGYVKSARTKCMADRKVTVFKQHGAQGGGDDEKVLSDRAAKSGDRYKWSVGNPGINGKFYARAGAIPGCKADNSPTIIG